MILKLDRRLRRLFRSLPDGTLSVVILGGHHRYPPVCGQILLQTNFSKPASSFSAHSPGLCLVEVKQDPQGETGSS